MSSSRTDKDVSGNPLSYILEIKTVQSSPFKILVEALKELLTDTCVEFDETGLKIVSMDTSECVLAHLKLDASKFEYYYCESKLTIGVNMLNLYKLIRTINSNDTLTLFIEAGDINHLGIKIENGEKNSKTTFKLNLLDLDNEKIRIDDVEFNTVINLPSTDFQKICRDMNNIAEHVEIKNIGNQLIFSCKGEFCNQETIIIDNNNGINTIQQKESTKTNDIVQGLFSLKYLVLFTKCTNLCSTVEIFLKNDYPVVVRYMVASLGSIKLCCSPQISSSTD
jgi:proliferating cell nuclear antigen